MLKGTLPVPLHRLPGQSGPTGKASGHVRLRVRFCPLHGPSPGLHQPGHADMRGRVPGYEVEQGVLFPPGKEQKALLWEELRKEVPPKTFVKSAECD